MPDSEALGIERNTALETASREVLGLSDAHENRAKGSAGVLASGRIVNTKGCSSRERNIDLREK